jgi:hypothetical protein
MFFVSPFRRLTSNKLNQKLGNERMMAPSAQAYNRAVTTWVAYACSWSVVKRNAYIAVLVGCVLSLINQYDAFAAHGFTPKLAVRVGLNFAIPFSVATISALVNRRTQES